MSHYKSELSYPRLMLSIQRALLGEVVSSLRGVAFDWSDEHIIIYFYIDGQLSEDLQDDFTSISVEVVANYTIATIEEKIFSIFSPEPLPKHEYWAYKRKE